MEEIIYFFFALVFSGTGVYLFDRFSRKKNFALGIDINKKEQNKTPEATGIVLLVLLWIFVSAVSFLNEFRIEIFYWLGLVSVFSLVGFVDDTTSKWKKKGLSWKERAFPVIIASFVFGFLVSGNIVNAVLLGFFVGVFSSFHNSFAGLNGWEVGSSYIIALFTAFLLIGTGFFLYAAIILALILGLLVFNIFPARVFPGDSGTLFMGSTITGLIALTMQKELLIVLAFFYLPHLIDFLFLKMLTNPKDPTQTKIKPYKILENKKLGIPDYTGKTRYDFAKLLIKIFGQLKERNIVLIIWLIVTVNCFFWLFVFGKITL